MLTAEHRQESGNHPIAWQEVLRAAADFPHTHSK